MANNLILELFTLCGNLKLYTRKEYKKKTIYFDITFTDLPQKLKRYKGSTKTTSLDKAKKIALLKVNSEYEKRKLYGVRSTQTPILQYLPKYYDWCLQQVENKATLKHKSGVRRWTANKAIHDKRGLEKYFVPFIKKNNINWSTLQQDKTMDKWVDVLRLHIADTSIQRYKGALNTLMRKAKKDGLMDKLPTFPYLLINDQLAEEEDGYAIATNPMLDDCFEIIEKLQEKSHLRDRWGYTLLDCWIRLLMDTGIRCWCSRPIKYSSKKHWILPHSRTRRNGDITHTPERIIVLRKDKTKYYAEGSNQTRYVINTLMSLYKAQGIETEYLFCNRDSTPNVSLNNLFYKVKDLAGWTGLTDEMGRSYTTYSIRKWHINKSIEAGDDGQDVALRCGHDYETLVRWYLDKTRRNKPVKANIWQRRKKLKSA